MVPKFSDRFAPGFGIADDEGFVAGVFESDKVFTAWHGVVHPPRLLQGCAGVVGPVKKEDGDLYGRGVVRGIVAEGVDTPFASAPKHQQIGVGERGHAHGAESVANGVAQGIEHGLYHQPVGLNPVNRDRAQNCHRSHALSKQIKTTVGKFIANESNHRRHVLRFFDAEAGVGFRGSTTPPEIHQQHRRAQFQKGGGRRNERGLFRGVSMEQRHQRRVRAPVHIPGLQRNIFRNPNFNHARGGVQLRGGHRGLRAGNLHPGEQNPKLLSQ